MSQEHIGILLNIISVLVIPLIIWYHNTQRAEGQSQLNSVRDLHKLSMDRFNEVLGQINSKLSTFEGKTEALEKRFQELEVEVARNYISRVEHTRQQGELVAEIKTLERKLEETKLELMANWKDFFSQLKECQVKNHANPK